MIEKNQVYLSKIFGDDLRVIIRFVNNKNKTVLAYSIDMKYPKENNTRFYNQDAFLNYYELVV